MPIILVRHAERVDYVTPGWTQTAERPWDTPLTPNGHKQARLAGDAIKQLCAKHDLPPPSRVVSSPLTRCVETATNIAAQLGVGSLDPEPALSETVCEKWFKSWAFEGISDSKWGGPAGHDWEANPPLQELLHPAARGKVSDLYLGYEAANKLANRTSPESEVKINADYKPAIGLEHFASYQWGSFETEQDLATRMGGFVAAIDTPDKTVVCVSHGGPCGSCYSHLTKEKYVSVPYTAIFVLVQPEPKTWVSLVTADNSHLQAGDDLGLWAAGKA